MEHTASFFRVEVRGISQSPSQIANDGVSQSDRAHDQIFVLVCKLLSCPCGGALSDERTGLSFVVG
jgi:hypothetical protein